MKTEHFNSLTEAEAERIAILMEECGEVVQICGKILRHGFESFSPYDAEKITNRELLTKELGDIFFAYKQMSNSDDIIDAQVRGMAEIKEFKIQQFLHHQQKSVLMSKVKFNLELLKGKEVAVNCATKEQAKEYATWVKSLGKDMCTNTYWNEDKEDTCYLLCHNLYWDYGSKETFENLGYKVISFEEALLPEEIKDK